MTRSAWDAAIEEYYAEHDRVLTDADAAAPALLRGHRGRAGGVGTVARRRIHDPEGHHDWVIDAVVDLDASDETGELVLAAVAMHRLGG